MKNARREMDTATAFRFKKKSKVGSGSAASDK
jgi:hypothetical protein